MLVAYEVAVIAETTMLPMYNVIIEDTDIEHAGVVLDMFIGFGNFDNGCRVAIMRREGEKFMFGLEWRFSWDSDGVEKASVKVTDEKGKRAVGISFDKKTVAGLVDVDQIRGIIRKDNDGHPELHIMYNTDLVKREKILGRVIEAFAKFHKDVNEAKVEVESGN